ncbi:MAG: tetratricopeptide repeat protein [Phycisphaerales bacterium]|nr:tetratricopeptide repeat protein [Phycisphaerales bacterium]
MNRTLAWALRLIIVIAGLVAYWNSLDGAFVYDDVPAILNNEMQLEADGLSYVQQSRRPLVALSIWLNYTMGGLNPVGYHLFNLAIHLINGLLLFELIRRLAGLVLKQDASGLAFAASLLWIVHPMGTESVTYIIQRSEAMAATCMLVVLLAILATTTSRRPMAWAMTAIVAAMAGMMCKATTISIAPVAFTMDALIISSSVLLAWRYRWGLYVALVLTSLLLVSSGVYSAIFASPTGSGSAVGFNIATRPWLDYAASQPGIILHYLGQSFWPNVLSIDPDFQPARSTAAVLWPGLIILVALGLTVIAVIRRHPLAFPAAAFFLLLAPTSSIVPIQDLAATHRMYLPLAAVIVIVVGCLLAVLRSLASRHTMTIGWIALAAVVISLTTRTIIRNRDFESPVTLWEATTQATPGNHQAWMNLGVALDEAGRTDEALFHLAHAVSLDPMDPYTHLHYGAALLETGSPGEAIRELNEAVIGLKRHWILLGQAYLANGELEQALATFERARQANPLAEVSIRIGNILMEAGHMDHSADIFRETAESFPEPRLRASALFNLGNVFYRQEQFDDAIEAYEAALQAAPDHAGATHWLTEARNRQASS